MLKRFSMRVIRIQRYGIKFVVQFHNSSINEEIMWLCFGFSPQTFQLSVLLAIIKAFSTVNAFVGYLFCIKSIFILPQSWRNVLLVEKKSHLRKMCLKERGVFLLCRIRKPLLCLLHMLTVFLLLSSGLSPWPSEPENKCYFLSHFQEIVRWGNGRETSLYEKSLESIKPRRAVLNLWVVTPWQAST